MGKKLGRPKVSKAEARVPGISIRLNKDESKTIQAAIKSSGLKQTDWSRKALLYVASNGIRLA